MDYVKSPLNYTGGKFKLLPQLLEIFPKDINTFVDLFAGGGNVAVNVSAKRIVYNDAMYQVPEMLQEFKSVGVERCLERIDRYIEEYQLSKENKDGYLKLRKQYNEPFNVGFSVQIRLCSILLFVILLIGISYVILDTGHMSRRILKETEYLSFLELFIRS